MTTNEGYCWEVVGGEDKGGILVRSGKETSSSEAGRLSFGAQVEQLDLQGDRLHYKRRAGTGGTGPISGWVSVKIKGKDLVIQRRTEGMSDTTEALDKAVPTETASADAPPEAQQQSVTEPMSQVPLLQAHKREKLGPTPSEDALKSPWLVQQGASVPSASLKGRIITLPFAGGSGHSLMPLFGSRKEPLFPESDGIEVYHVNLPGRGSRAKEKPIDDMTEIRIKLAHAIGPLARHVPYVIFGHSMGSSLAMEVTRELVESLDAPLPASIIVSGRGPPHLKDPDPALWDLDDKGLHNELKVMGSPLGDVSLEDAKTQFPLLRADDRIAQELLDPFRVPVPLHVFFGDGEKGLVTVPFVQKWEQLAGDSFNLKIFSGGDHWYLFSDDHRIAFQKELRSLALQALL